MLQKKLSKIAIILTTSVLLFSQTNASTFDFMNTWFNDNSLNAEIEQPDSTSNESDQMSCSKGVMSNSTTYKDQYFDCDLKIWANFDALKWSNIEVTWNLRLWSNADIEWDLIVGGNLELDANLTVWWNLIVTWNITWESSNIDVVWYTKANNIEIGANLDTKAIISTGYVSLWSNSTIERWISTYWYLMTWSNTTINGISIIRWEFRTESNFDWNWTIYIYWNLTWWSNFTFNWDKIKVTNDLTIWSNWDNIGRIFIYWKKSKGSNYGEEKHNYWYLIWEVDPLLKYNLTKSEFNTIKNTTVKADKRVYYYKQSATEQNSYIQKLYNSNTDWKNDKIISQKIYDLNNLKQSTLWEYKKIFEYLDKYIENETFDIKMYNELKTRRLNDLNTFLNSMYWTNNKVEIVEIEKKDIKKTEKIETKKQLKQEEKIKETKKENIENENIKENNKEDKTINITTKKEILSIWLTNKLDNLLSNIEGRYMEEKYNSIIKKIDKMLEKEDENLKIDRSILEKIKKYIENDLEERNIINQIFG